MNFLQKLILSEKNAFFHIFTATKPQRLIIYSFKSETSWLLKGYVFLEPIPKNTDTLGRCPDTWVSFKFNYFYCLYSQTC